MAQEKEEEGLEAGTWHKWVAQQLRRGGKACGAAPGVLSWFHGMGRSLALSYIEKMDEMLRRLWEPEGSGKYVTGIKCSQIAMEKNINPGEREED